MKRLASLRWELVANIADSKSGSNPLSKSMILNLSLGFSLFKAAFSESLACLIELPLIEPEESIIKMSSRGLSLFLNTSFLGGIAISMR